jgi:hypothetical protein
MAATAAGLNSSKTFIEGGQGKQSRPNVQKPI